MVVKVVIERKIKQGKAREVFSLLNKFRSDAMNHKGYITGETLINHDDPQEILVIGMWQGMENWMNWRDNPERKANEARITSWLEGPATYKTYVLGNYFAQFGKMPG